MKKLFFIIFLSTTLPAFAVHISGGELFYEYLGPGSASNSSRYKITLRLFRGCNTNRDLDNVYTIGIYHNGIIEKSLPLILVNNKESLNLSSASFPPCLTGNISVCYQLGIYSATTELTDTQNGYVLNINTCCRITDIKNIINSRSNGSGATYSTNIPGILQLGLEHSSSPQFFVRDTTLVCANKKFTLDFGATDPDNDSLSYSFCEAYDGQGNNNNNTVSSFLNQPPLTYTSPYSGSDPLGSNVVINDKTGKISGIAPSPGNYVVNVCITEWRKGKIISQHRKDFILLVQNCDFIEADLPDKIIQCKDDFTVHFENGSTSSQIQEYLWRTGDPLNPADSFSTPTVDYTYKDTGTFTAHLTIVGPKGCTGHDSTTVIVYPGFKPGFVYKGSCYLKPFNFTDTTSTRYGLVNSWHWNLGDADTNADTSNKNTATYLYPTPVNRTVSLIVTSNKGCIDTAAREIVITKTPPINLPFRDTLICKIDTLQLHANTAGDIAWIPNYRISDTTVAHPFVNPQTTTSYKITVLLDGCTSTDSIKVNVLPFITVNAGADTLICKTDTIRLKPVSQGLGFKWTSSTNEPVASEKYPLIQPLDSTYYYVLANLGKCQAKDTVHVKVAPYPISDAGTETSVCFGNRTILNGNVTAHAFQWSPTSSLLNTTTLTPVAGPSKTTRYFLTASYFTGCPKPVTDSVIVNVIPQIKIFAGNDTTVVINQPLQLMAVSGNDNLTLSYSWRSSTALNNPFIYNPVATLGAAIDSIQYTVRATTLEGCFGEDALKIKVFKTDPDLFIPSAFTPNEDSKNDILKPIAVGITSIDYFKVFNRWGQLIYTTSQINTGWDGKFNGTAQPAGTYVYVAQGSTYAGKTVFKKGTVVLIR